LVRAVIQEEVILSKKMVEVIGIQRKEKKKQMLILKIFLLGQLSVLVGGQKYLL